MMKRDGRDWQQRLALVAALFGSTLACAERSGPADAMDRATQREGVDAVAVEQAVIEMLARYRIALAAGDFETVVNTYADDARFFWVEDGSVRYESRAEVGAALEQVKQFGPATYTFGEPRVEVLSGDLAMVFTDVDTQFGDPASGGFAFSVAQTILVAKLNGEWRFLNGHSSSPRARQ